MYGSELWERWTQSLGGIEGLASGLERQQFRLGWPVEPGKGRSLGCCGAEEALEGELLLPTSVGNLMLRFQKFSNLGISSDHPEREKRAGKGSQNSCVLAPPGGRSQNWPPGARLAPQGPPLVEGACLAAWVTHYRLGKAAEERRCLINFRRPPASRQPNAKHLVSLEREKEK